jgi:hypothetical protein
MAQSRGDLNRAVETVHNIYEAAVDEGGKVTYTSRKQNVDVLK